MNDVFSTKAGVFETGDKDADGVLYKDNRLLSCRNPKLEEYTVAEGTEVICDRAFMNMKELRRLRLPESIKSIGESAFSGCNALADIDIPEGVSVIRQATFRDCESLSTIELPSSIMEIEKFAFGRGLTTLVVNAMEMAIDKYAFMNARDLRTLIVPAGSADYYHTLLAEIRVKAEVEENSMQSLPDEPSSMLDMIVSATAEEVKEITKGLFKSNNMEEEKKFKTVTVEVFGYEKWLEPKDSDEDECYDAISRFAEDGMIFTVGDKEYTPSDFSDADDFLTPEQQEIYKELDASEFFAESGAEEGWLYLNKAWTTIDIEMPEDEDFDPSKAALVIRDFIYPDESDEPTVCAFVYDGKVYDCAPEDSRGISGEKIWPVDDNEDDWDEDDEWEEETHTKESDSENVKMDFRFGFVDKTGQFIIEPKFENVGDFHCGLAKIEDNKLCGYINKTGEIVIEPKFTSASDFSDALAKVEIDGKYGFIDTTGEFVIDPKFSCLQVGNFHEGLANICIDDKEGYIDKSGNIAIEARFERAYEFNDEVAKVKVGGKWGYIDKSGNFVIEPKFDSSGDFSEGLASFEGDDGYGYIDKTGEVIIEPKFEDAGDFNDGLAWVYIDDEYGYIDKTGEFVINPKFEDAGDFKEGIAWVAVNEEYGCIDKTGKYLFNQKFASANSFSDGVARVYVYGPVSE